MHIVRLYGGASICCRSINSAKRQRLTGTNFYEITVTAQRRTENLQMCQSRIQAFTVKTLKATQIATFDDIIKICPM